MPDGIMSNLSGILNRPQGSGGENRPAVQVLAPNDIERESQATEVPARARLKAHREWCGAIAALESLLLELAVRPTPQNTATDQSCQGVLLSGPAVVLRRSDLAACFYRGIFREAAAENWGSMSCQLAAAAEQEASASSATLPILPADPLAAERFCLALTPWFSLLLVVGEDSRGLPAFQFSFEPDVAAEAWQVLRSRLVLANSPQFAQLEGLVSQFSPTVPDYRLVMQFSRQLLQHLPEQPPASTRPLRLLVAGNGERHRAAASSHLQSGKLSPEVELLQALTHEIRTPLTTIRTIARLLLRNPNLHPAMAHQLQAIDRECTEQIDRMELIFRAIELETAACQEAVQLVPMSFAQVLQAGLPRWKKQAERRNLELDVILPPSLPQVVSNPAMFDRVLAGLMEKFTCSLPMGGKIRLEVTTAGNQLKLQFHTQSACPANPLKSLGHLLVFQPETGSLSLNLNVTKNLFQALGGKLIVRQRSQQEEIFTIFFPLGNSTVYAK